jgi:hypothetical protein
MTRRLFRGFASKGDWADDVYQSAREEEAMAEDDRRREAEQRKADEAATDEFDANGPRKVCGD